MMKNGLLENANYFALFFPPLLACPPGFDIDLIQDPKWKVVGRSFLAPCVRSCWERKERWSSPKVRSQKEREMVLRETMDAWV